MRSPSTRLAAGLILLCLLTTSVLAWDAVGHRAIAWLALDGLSKDMPAWLRDQEQVREIGWDAAEPDRWRGTHSAYLQHENAPDHYLDIEDLAHYGLTLRTLPKLRYQYVAAMTIALHEHPGGVDGHLRPYNPKLDPSGQQQWPGFLPYAILEHYAKLTSSFKTYRTLEKLADPARVAQLEMAKNNIRSEMGLLAHFVGDAAQPLHTTHHHHGWVNDSGELWKNNPDGFSTDRSIHAFIDGEVVKLHDLDYHSLHEGQKFDAKVDAADPWDDVLAYIERSHTQVRRLYELEKSGALRREEGKAFIAERLRDSASMLAAMYNAAWSQSEPTQKDIDDFVKYDAFSPRQQP